MRCVCAGSDDFDLISHNGEDEVVIEGECGATEEEEGDEENVEDDEDDEDNVMVEFVHDDGFDVDELIDQVRSLCTYHEPRNHRPHELVSHFIFTKCTGLCRKGLAQ